MSSYFDQTWAVLQKNFLVSWRTKEFVRELVSVAIFVALIGVIHHFGESNDMDIPFYMTLAITSYSRAMVITWVGERQTRQKEIQQIMGLNPYAHFTAWILYFLLNGIYVSVFFVLPLKALGAFDNINIPFMSLMMLYFLYMLSSFFFVLFLSSFFNDAKIAAQGVTFIQLLASLLYFLTFVKEYCQNGYLLKLSSIFPPLAYDFAVVSTGLIDPIYQLNYSYSTGMTALGLDALVYFILFVYFEQVLPHEFGTARHPLFFLPCFGQRSKAIEDVNLMDINSMFDTSSAKYNEDINIRTPQTAQVYNVTKSFGELKAVDQLTLSLYEREIFCLLGHNGAGKSTTINILTGLSNKDSGKIIINGMDLDTDLAGVRKCLGLCLQQNVLYDNLTIEDHLRFYCRVKGIPSHQIEEQIETTIIKCALAGQRGKFSVNLSGGNKRKLSLANALVGGSKVVFLDQPSSGLDPNSRQSIWDILREVRNQNRTVVLTTHHLEEAEALAQRIGIMTHGRLLILGSCDYIKQKFGVGYHLLVTINEEQRQDVMAIINAKLPNIRLDQQSANNVLKYILPLNRQSEFAQLFRALEPLGLSVSLKMCTLEDTFVNIGINGNQLQDQRTEFPQPQIDQPVNISPVYSFSAQFQAIFNKKSISTFRSFSTVTSIALPVLFMLVGTIVTVVAFKQIPDNITPDIWNYIKLSVLAYFMVWAFIFNTSAFCGSIVLEREKRFKYLSNVMGLRKLPYWLANFTFDFLIFIVPVGVFFIVTLAMGKPAQFLTSKIQFLVPVFILFGFSFMTYSYAWSFAFQKSNTAYRFFPFLNFLFFYMLPMISVYAAPNSSVTLYLMPAISPFMAFYFVFFTTKMGNFAIFIPNYQYLLLILFFQGVFFSVLTYFLESIRFSLKDRYQVHQDDVNTSAIQDEDVKLEQARVGNLDHVEPIVVNKLYKKYNNGYVGVRNNTFMVEPGEMFGLLGPNGAGKSTTFNVLTAAIAKTAGSVKLSGVEINKGIMEVFQDVGICPQFDSIYDNLTVTEHLKYFAQLKGQSTGNANKLVEYYLKVMQLDQYAKVMAGKLSGGNKRKLSVSMALICNPKLMFFDEPSSAVDPIARRFLWKTLNDSLRYSGSSIVLTTHSMNEAESLCSRIGILIKGKFVCMGTPASLKRKFGNGFSIIAKLPTMANLGATREQVKTLYPQFRQYVDEESMKVTFQVPTEIFSFSKTFDLFEGQLVRNGVVESFQTSQSSLQQIFLFFSRMQPVELNQAVRAEPWDLCCFQWGAEGCFLAF